MMSILPKSKPKFIQQHHKLPTLSKFQKPPTLPKLHQDQRKKHTSRMLLSQHSKHDQSHNAPKISKVIISHHVTFNKTCNNILPSKETKETLVSTWQYGAWVLGSWRSPSLSCHSNIGSYFLPWEVRKEDLLEEEAILMQREWVLENGFHQKWVHDEMLKNTRIWRDIYGDGWGKLEKLRKVFFMRRNGEMKKKIQGEEESE